METRMNTVCLNQACLNQTGLNGAAFPVIPVGNGKFKTFITSTGKRLVTKSGLTFKVK